jgi:glutamate-ammonia-ligase adenylyltransferase
VQALLVLFSQSEYLAEVLTRSPDLLFWLDQARRNDRLKTPEELLSEVGEYCIQTPHQESERSGALARFRRREMLRVALRDLLGQATLAETTLELSHLADAVIAQASQWAWSDLAARFGVPRREARIADAKAPDARRNVPRPIFPVTGAALAEGRAPLPNTEADEVQLAVIGLGKLGGAELNYSSDIDLLFIYGADGQTDATGTEREPVTNHEFFTRMAQQVTRYLGGINPEGAAYRVDLRLRPGGREGDIAVSLARARTYYFEEAREWEWQMLIKARHCAGPPAITREFLAAVAPLIYREEHNFEAVESVLLARDRISAQLETRRTLQRESRALDVKLDPGGIRDIEFLVQCLQRVYGGRDEWVRSGPTLVAMQRLVDKGYLHSGDFQLLSTSYRLLRSIEHRLQLRHDRQTHSLPEDPAGLLVLARSIVSTGVGIAGADSGYGAGAKGETAKAKEFVEQVTLDMRRVRDLYESLLHSRPQITVGGDFRLEADRGGEPGKPLAGFDAARRLHGLTVSRRGQANLQRLLDSALTVAGALRELSEISDQGFGRLMDALNRSDFVAARLAQRPLNAVVFDRPILIADERQRELLEMPRREGSSLAARVLAEAAGYRDRVRLLRVAHQERLLQMIAGELMAPAQIGEILRRLTHLAEDALECALQIASAEEAADRPGEPLPNLAVIALGRMGLHEFDVFSDLDLVFVSDQDGAARLAARTIETLTAYTQEGMLFAVDTRLRPGGGEGELVQSVSGLANYFRERASAWEAVSYLKARGVAGDHEIAAEALRQIRPIIYRRFADPKLLKAELGAMRARIERESRSGSRDLKTGRGGYYDLDFILSSLALRRADLQLAGLTLAGIAKALASPSLGTPELDRQDASELASLAATLRAADHSLRVATGTVVRSIPEDGHFANVAGDLMARILRRPLPQGLAAAVAEANTRIREIYRERLG